MHECGQATSTAVKEMIVMIFLLTDKYTLPSNKDEIVFKLNCCLQETGNEKEISTELMSKVNG